MASEALPYVAQILIGLSLLAAFYGVLYPDTLRDNWDSPETRRRITRFSRGSRIFAVVVLVLGVVCLALSRERFSASLRVFLLLLTGGVVYAIWPNRTAVPPSDES